MGGYNGSSSYAGWNHTHGVTYGEASVTAPQATMTTSATETNLPPYHELNIFKATSEAPLSAGDIVMTTGNVPRGWTVISQDEFYVRATSNTQLSSGGSPSHTHANINHTHTKVSHTHTGTCGAESRSTDNAANDPIDQGLGVCNTNHRHSVSVANADESFGNADTAFGNASMTPPTITVKFIQATSSALGGGNTVFQHFM
jgi:hypothetical protein